MTHRERQRIARAGTAICLVLPFCLILILILSLLVSITLSPQDAEARGGRAQSGL